jgi:hypothetical protein
MPSINVGQQGHGASALRSTPKITRINGDDVMPLVYRNMGNNHAYPFIFAGTVTVTGSEAVTVMSGVKFHGMNAADYCLVTVGGTVNATVQKDIVANTVSITPVASGTVDYMVMVGDPNYDIEKIACRGNKVNTY